MSTSKEPIRHEIEGRQLKCQFCGHAEFKRMEGQLNTKTASLFNLDWINPSATCLVCDKCGFIHWFLPK